MKDAHTSTTRIIDTVNVRDLNTQTSSIGVSRRSCRTMNHTSATAATASVPTSTGLLQPNVATMLKP